MKAHKPWHRRWHGNALNGTRTLSLELRGAYQTLQDLMYDADGPIRLEERRICGEFDCDVRVLRRVLGGLIAADKIRLWSDGKAVWIVNDKVLRELKEDGFSAETSAALSPDLQEKFGIANAELSPKSGGKRNKNSETDPAKSSKIAPLEEEEEERPPIVPQGDNLLLLESEEVDPVRVAFDGWNDLAKRCGLPMALDLTDGRRRALSKRLKTAGPAGWAAALAAVEVSAFCRGQCPGRDGAEPFRADLDFVCQAKSFQRLREGKYGKDAKGAAAPITAAPKFTGPPALRAMVTAAQGEGFAASYIDPATWRASDRTLIAANAFAAKTINTECAALIRETKIKVLAPQEAGAEVVPFRHDGRRVA